MSGSQHYNSLLKFEKDNQAALNNIGVIYDKLSMPGKSIEYYKKACHIKETLFAANLASKYMTAGFIEEAHKILEEARKEDNVHENVGDCIMRLSRIKQNELDIKEKAFKEANKQQNFMRRFAEAFFTKDITTSHSKFSGKWKFSDGFEIDIVQDKFEIKSEWLRGNDTFKLEGKVNNMGATINYRILPKYLQNSISIGYVMLSQDEIELQIMLLNESSSFINLTKVI